MNKAITDGLVLAPPAFSAGLDVWSSEDGTPGGVTYDAIVSAAVVPGWPFRAWFFDQTHAADPSLAFRPMWRAAFAMYRCRL